MKFWFDTLKSRLLLTLITYCLYMLMYTLTDEHLREFYSGELPLWGYMLDVGTTLIGCSLFVQLSILYSRLIFKRFYSVEKPYSKLLACSVLLLLMNNATAYLLSLLTEFLFSEQQFVSFNIQHLYVYSILATFISSIYINAYYLHSYMDAEAEMKKLEMVAMQAQLNALKQQIDPHFMFNNFSILSELILEDRDLAVKFLTKLSKVYRYVIQNYHRDTVPVTNELDFIDSYLYLMEIRYEGAVVVGIDTKLRQCEGSIPPVCLQLLVENALKHNRFSEKHPLMLSLSEEEGYIVVSNTMQPLASKAISTGVGQHNIFSRYALLCDREPIVECTDETYTVRLPII